MELEDLLNYLNNGNEVQNLSEAEEMIDNLLLEAIRIKSKLNCEYHTEEEIREIFAELTSHPVNETLRLVPPFHTDCGKNIHIGENVFINANCTMQDQGGIYIGDNVWIGDKVTILPNVTIGKGCIIAANAVVTKDIPEYSVAAGVPAKVIKIIK